MRADDGYPWFFQERRNGSTVAWREAKPDRFACPNDLLSHTAGFWGSKNITPEKIDLIRNSHRPLAESVKLIAEYDLVYEPGTKWIYSGTGYCVASRVAEVALGQSLEEIARDALFRPLDMNHTTFLPSKEALS